jgi:integrase
VKAAIRGIEAAKLRIQQAVAAANTFEALARGWFALQEGRWTPVHAKDVISSLEKDVVPWVGKLPITEIDEPMVLSVLRKIEKRGAIETAHRIRQRMSAIFVHAIAEGVGSRDPAAIVTRALKPVPRSRKRPALVTMASLHDMLRKSECEPASPLTKLASRFLALTAQRPGMIRALPWGEIENVDWQDDGPTPDALWRVPAQRMKLTLDLKSDDGFEHLIPLSAQAVDVLRAAYILTGRGPMVFPGNRNARNPNEREYMRRYLERRFLGSSLAGFLRLGEEVDLLGDDLAAIAVGAILVGPFGVVDAARDHDHCALGDMLGDAFADAVEAGDPVPFGLGLAVAFAVLEAAGCGE